MFWHDGTASTRRKLLRNAASLYAVQACAYLLPLITFPYLGRVLGPEAWGTVLFCQAIGMIIAIVVEYGFDFSATREAARFSDDRQRLRELVTGVLGAKLMLALLVVGGAALTRPYTVRVASSSALFWASVSWGVGQGISMLWYFQGLQRMTWAGGLDIAGRIIATISIFALVHRPEDGWKVMMAQALGCGVSHVITVGMAYYEVGFCRLNCDLLRRTLVLGWPMFLFRASMSLLTSANGIILGFFASATAVGYFGSADKFRIVAFQGLWPINQTLFPHQSQQVKDDPMRGLSVVQRSLALIGALSACFGVVLLLSAPLLVRLILGRAFLPAVPALRVFAIMIPLQALTTVITTQWMLPLGFDRESNFVVLTSGVVNVVAGILLSLRAGALGMAIAVTVAQLYAVLALEIILRRKGLSPLMRRRGTVQQSAVEAAKL